MKRVLPGMVLLLIFAFGCGKKDSDFKLEKDTPTYQLAKELSQKLDYLDPDKNNVLASTKSFNLTVGEAIAKLTGGSGSNVERLKNLGKDDLRSFLARFTTQFAERKLLLGAANKAKVALSETERDSVLKKQYERYGGEEKFIANSKSRNINVDFLKKELLETALISKFLEKTLADSVKVTDEEIQAEYEKDKTATVQHILLLTQGKSDSAKQEIYQKMEGILAEAKSGKDFAELAKKYSEDPGSKDKGGLYEDFGKGRMVKPFEDAAFNVPIGEISDIITTQYGYHILKVINRKHETKLLEEVRAFLVRDLTNKKRTEVTQAFLQRLKEKANFVQITF